MIRGDQECTLGPTQGASLHRPALPSLALCNAGPQIATLTFVTVHTDQA
jgi:hypothetical protein